jgi:hypothetical protein
MTSATRLPARADGLARQIANTAAAKAASRRIDIPIRNRSETAENHIICRHHSKVGGGDL